MTPAASGDTVSHPEGTAASVAHDRYLIHRFAVAHEKNTVEIGHRLDSTDDLNGAPGIRERYLFAWETVVDRQFNQRARRDDRPTPLQAFEPGVHIQPGRSGMDVGAD